MDFIEVEEVRNADTIVMLSRVTEVSLPQPENTLLPMLVTAFGIVIEVKNSHSLNASSAMPTTFMVRP